MQRAVQTLELEIGMALEREKGSRQTFAYNTNGS